MHYLNRKQFDEGSIVGMETEEEMERLNVLAGYAKSTGKGIYF